jgi:hypothetical protein
MICIKGGQEEGPGCDETWRLSQSLSSGVVQEETLPGTSVQTPKLPTVLSNWLELHGESGLQFKRCS